MGGGARVLAAEPMRQAGLVHLLTVLAHGRARPPQSLEELEERFRAVLAEEIFRVKEVHPGFAEALLFAATVRNSGYDLSRSSVIALADYYQPGTSFLSLLDPENRGWSLARAPDLPRHGP